MKKIIFMAIILATSLCYCNAQVVVNSNYGPQSSEETSKQNSTQTDKTSQPEVKTGSFVLEYNYLLTAVDGTSSDDGLHGFTVGWRTNSKEYKDGIFFGTGFLFNMLFSGENSGKYGGLQIPIEIGYGIDLGSNDLALAPFIGEAIKWNFIGSAKNGDHKIDFYDKEDMGEDGKWSYFTWPLSVGMKLFTEKIILTAKYDHYFGGFGKKTSANGFSISVGFRY